MTISNIVRDRAVFSKNISSIRRHFGDYTYVAIYDSRIVDYDNNRASLLERLRMNYDPRRVYVSSPARYLVANGVWIPMN